MRQAFKESNNYSCNKAVNPLNIMLCGKLKQIQILIKNIVPNQKLPSALLLKWIWSSFEYKKNVHVGGKSRELDSDTCSILVTTVC